MKIDQETIERVAANARLQLTPLEKKQYLKDLQDILSAFEKLAECNTDKVQTSIQPIPLSDVFRDDIEKECLSQDDALSLTKHSKNGYFKGPKAL